MTHPNQHSPRQPWEWDLAFAHQVQQWVDKGMCLHCSINVVASTYKVGWEVVEDAYNARKTDDDE